MTSFRRVLVDLDTLAPAHPALAQAFDVARRYDAAVTLVDVLPDVPRGARQFVTPEVEAELVEDRRTRLAALAAAAPAGVAVDTRVLRGRAGLALIKAVLRGGYDLLMRSHDRRSGEARPFGAVDMQLLRYCPVPVWLIRRDTSVPPRRVLAAIDPSGGDDQEEPLNRSIVEVATRLRDPSDVPVTVMYVWDAFGEDLMQPRLSAEEFREFVRAAEQNARDAMDAFVGTLGPGLSHIEPRLVKGLPEEAIPGFVRDHGVELLVMGTVARTGIAGLLIGNTAERVLQRVRASVLAVKPRGFVSPVTLDD